MLNAGAVFGLMPDEGFGLRDTPGGVSANVWLNDHEAVCWSTQPPALPTFYAKNRKGYCVVGSRPRLVHAASVLSQGHRFDPAYGEKYLVSGFAVDGLTGYPGVRALEPNRSLGVKDGDVEILPYPLSQPEAVAQNVPLKEKGLRLAGLLLGAVWTAKYGAKLFLSGGKDSRALSCALKAAGAKVDAFTLGATGAGEGPLAEEVARAAGFGFEVKRQGIITDPLKAAYNSNALSDGLGIAFAHQFDFASDLSHLDGQASFHGHGHLLRGGFARSMAASADRLNAAIDGSFISPFVVDEAKDAPRKTLADWLEARKLSFSDGREILFYGNQDFRLGLFTAPSSLDLTSKTFMIYPLLDERVARFAASLSMFDKVTERVVFEAMRQLDRGLTDIPLYGEIWRFDRDPDRRDFLDSDHNFQDGYELRKPRETGKLNGLGPSGSGFIYDADKGSGVDRVQVIGQHIKDAGWIMPLVIPQIRAEIEYRAAHGKVGDSAGMDANAVFNLDAFIKRCFIASTLTGTSW